MLPESARQEQAYLKQDFIIQQQPGLTYRLDMEQEAFRGLCNGLDAVKQAVYKILMTERYAHSIYSWNYGVELDALIGRQMNYAEGEIPRRIKSALLQDDRIRDVTNFKLERTQNQVAGAKNALRASFTVVSTEGSFEAARVVNL